MKKSFLLGLLALGSLAVGAQNRSLVFDKGEAGSKFYRIPAIEVTADGTLVALADKRWDNNADLPGRIDVVAKRSTDKGATWSSPVVVMANDEGGGYGDPLVILNAKNNELVCVATHGAGLFADTLGCGSRIVLSKSADNGQTWTAPRDITDMVFDGKKWYTSFATSGRGLQLKDGRMMFVLVVRELPGTWSDLSSYACFSDDGGRTWRRAKMPATRHGDESKVVELPSGKLLMSIRRKHGGPRYFSLSNDRGNTWSEPFEAPTLPDQGCNGDILLLEREGRQPVLVHSLPADPKLRTNVSLFVSDDEGHTWRRTREICPTGSAYSSVVKIDDASLGVLTEEDASDSDGGFRLWFTQVPVEEVVD